MRIRDSGMPEEQYWETLLNVDLILDRLGIGSGLRDVIELGCGYGTFTVPVARRIAGTLRTFDLEQAMVTRTRQRVAEAGLTNVLIERRDVMSEGFGVPPESQDGALLFNILHGEEPVRLLAETARCLRPGGSLFAIHWRWDPATPRGPSLDIRPRPEQIIAWSERTRLLRPVGSTTDLLPWHFGVVLRRLGGDAVATTPTRE